MQVILKKEVNGLGYQYDVVNVKPGYARNYLIPNGIAEIASPSALKVRDEIVKQKAHKEEKIIKDANELAAALEKVVLNFKMKTQDAGKTYGSVNAAMIADAIKERFSYDIDKNDILLKENIKEIGETLVKVKVFKNIQPQVKVIVEKELTEEEIAAKKAEAHAKAEKAAAEAAEKANEKVEEVKE
jgi:large subunit ribosomal protein L9